MEAESGDILTHRVSKKSDKYKVGRVQTKHVLTMNKKISAMPDVDPPDIITKLANDSTDLANGNDAGPLGISSLEDETPRHNESSQTATLSETSIQTRVNQDGWPVITENGELTVAAIGKPHDIGYLQDGRRKQPAKLGYTGYPGLQFEVREW